MLRDEKFIIERSNLLTQKGQISSKPSSNRNTLPVSLRESSIKIIHEISGWTLFWLPPLVNSMLNYPFHNVGSGNWERIYLQIANVIPYCRSSSNSHACTRSLTQSRVQCVSRPHCESPVL